MENFEIFYERKERNPLRKKELNLAYDNKEAANREIAEWEQNKPKEVEDTYQILKRRDPEKAEQFLQKKRDAISSEWLKKKVTPEYKKVLDKFGFQVFADPNLGVDIGPGTYYNRVLELSIRNIVKNMKDIIPIRKPKIIISDLSTNPLTKNTAAVGKDFQPAGLYSFKDKLIYIDLPDVDNPDVLVHEYAHYLSNRIPKQYDALIMAEYKKLLNAYFEKNTKRKDLGGDRNAKLRDMVAKKLGLPSDYSATNPDEFFAEIITHWKNMPNNVNTYRFKTMMKKILTRL